LKKGTSILSGIIGIAFIILGILGPFMGLWGMFPSLGAILLGAGLTKMSYNYYKKSGIPEKDKIVKKQPQKTYQKPVQQPVKSEKSQGRTLIPKVLKTEQNLNNIFISYRRNDSADVTGRIYDKLLQSFDKKQLFKDVDSIPLGVDFLDHLNQKVGECNVLIAIIGPYWIESNIPKGQKRIDDEKDFVRIEIESALERKIPVIPVLVRGAKMPSSEHLPDSLKGLAFRNGIPVRPDPDFHRDMERLIQGIKHHI
jgi:hypothetical protein